MKKKDLLYEFIQSLNKNEITFFKKYVSLFSKGKKPTYYTIFEYFLTAKNFNESIIKKKIGSSYAVHKSQLFERLISALSAYNSQEDPIAKSLDYLTVASMAAKKQLYSTADYLVDKAEKSMSGHPALTIPLFVKHFKMLLLKSPHQENGDIETAKKLYDEIKKSTQNYLIHHELNLLSIKIYHLGRSKKDKKWMELLNEVSNNYWVKNYNLIINPIDQLMAIKLNYKVAILKGEHQKAFNLQKEEILIIEANENLIRLNPINYLVPLYNIVDEAIKLNYLDIANDYLKKMNSITSKYEMKNNSILVTAIKSYYIPLKSKLIANSTPDTIVLKEIEQLIHESENFSETNEKASLAHQTNFYCAIALLKKHKYNDALGLLAIFEYENHEMKILPEFETSVEILRLICFYELELFDLLEAKIRSFARKPSHVSSKEYLPLFRALLKAAPKKNALHLLPNNVINEVPSFNNYFSFWMTLNLN